MVYDEGWDIEFQEMSFFAFSKYAIDNNDSNGGKNYKSQCYSTCVGWYRTKDRKKWGCYQAIKKGVNANAATYVNPEKTNLSIVQPADNNNIDSSYVSMSFKSIDKDDDEDNDGSKIAKHILQPTMTSFLEETESAMSHLNAEFTKHHLYINKLNSIKKSWSAALHKDFENMSIKELNKMAGIPRARRFRFKAESEDIIEDLSQFPKAFDWKDKLKEAGSQGNCGSCYVYSTMRMLEARLKILFDHNIDLSVQHALDCSFYNQGCGGGYPYLVMKYSSEFELIPESCKSYQEATGQCYTNTCNINDLPYIYRTKDYKYVGGSYGSCSERAIMDEVYHNGPIVVSFEPDYNFMMYKSGVYHSIGDDTWITHAVPKPEWEKVDHSVLLVGWGEENGEKYWLIQNTWGPNWGEKGFFRMLRGKDEFGIESICEAAVPLIIDNKTKKEIYSKDELGNANATQITKSIFDELK
jgi:cathepsin C